MILRGTVLSERHILLDAQRFERPLQGTVPSTAPAAATEAGLSSESRGLEGAPGEAISPLPPEQAPLSLDDVIAWLATADESAIATLTGRLAADIDRIHADAQEEGFKAGHARGLKEAQEKAQGSLASLATLAGEAETAFAMDSALLAEQCADVVLAAFTKLAGQQLATREAVIGAVLEVLRRVKDDRKLVIRVSALDLAVLQSAQEEIARALEGRKFSLVPDSRVETGGCIVESQLGSLDGRLDLQLQALCETIRAAKTARGQAP